MNASLSSKSLEEVVGKDSVFIDVDSIEVGVDFRRVLEARFKAADIMFALIGPRWLEDEDGAGHRRLDDPVAGLVIRARKLDGLSW